MDWEKYEEKLSDKFEENNKLFTGPIDTPDKLECATNCLFRIIDETTAEVGSTIKISPHMK